MNATYSLKGFLVWIQQNWRESNIIFVYLQLSAKTAYRLFFNKTRVQYFQQTAGRLIDKKMVSYTLRLYKIFCGL